VAESDRPAIWVLAGASGAGKSSVGGAMFRARGAEYYNPDEAAALLRREQEDLDQEEADSRAWHQGRRLLERAIEERMDFVFETTLGGKSMTAKLQEAAALGFEVNVWFVGLASPELNIERVRAREAAGGHGVSDILIRKRYDDARNNLILLIPFLAGLRVYDNSHDGDPMQGRAPKPRLLLHMTNRTIAFECAPEDTPEWVKPILVAARNLAVT
jgi:predicted ABC-type ATPase